MKIRSRMLSRFLVSSLLIAMYSHAYIGPQPPEPDRLWFAILPRSPIASMTEYDQSCQSYIPEAIVDKPVEAMLIEFRRLEDQHVIARIPYSHFGQETYPRGYSRSSEYVEAIRAELKELPDGDYLVALTIKGKRCSNVAQFTVDSDAVISELPVLEAVALEPPPYCALPFLGLRVTGSDALGETFKASDVVYGNVVVDDVPRPHTIAVWCGPDPELRPAQRWERILNLSGFRDPQIDLGVEHLLKFRVGKYTAGPIKFNPDQPLGESWDAATKSE